MASGVALEVATLGGYTFALGFHEAAGFALMTSGYIQAMHHVKDLSMPPSYRTMETTPSWSNRIEWQKRKKEGTVDPSLPEDPCTDPNLEDISHPKAKDKGKYRFKDKNTGEILEWHKGTPGEPGHRGRDHYHRPNPNATGERDKYLDGSRNPVAENSEPSHIYPPS